MIHGDDWPRDELLIGTVNFGGSIGLCKIYIYGKESTNVDHFHILSTEKDFDCCVCIFKAEYMINDEKNKLGRMDVLENNIQKKILNKWLSENHHIFKGSNWEMIRLSWMLEKENYDFPLDTKQPNYVNMKNFININKGE